MLPHPSLHPPGTLLEQNTGVKKQTCSPLFLMPRSLTHSHTCTHRHTRRRTTVSSSRATVGLGFIANKGRRKTPPQMGTSKAMQSDRCKQVSRYHRGLGRASQAGRGVGRLEVGNREAPGVPRCIWMGLWPGEAVGR